MRKIIAAGFVSLDGVMQAPGGPQEDPEGGFKFGGWTFHYWDDIMGAAMGEIFAPDYALLLGRKTYDIFASHWPHVRDDPMADALNAVTKYVATHRPESLTWKNSEGLGKDPIATLRKMKSEDGPKLLTQGSTDLLHQLLAADLIDEIRLLIFPVVLGKGKKLFSDGAVPAALKLVKSEVSTTGVIIASYERAGEIRTGSFQLAEPSTDEVERRKNFK